MFKLTLEKQIPLAFLIAIILLVIISLLTYRSTNNIDSAVKWEKHTQAILLGLDDVLVSALEAESGSRGFVNTGNDIFSEPIKESERKISENLQNLRNLLQDNPEQIAKLDALQSQINQKVLFSRQLVEVRRRQGLNAAIELANTQRGKILMDAVRRSVNDLKNEEQNILKEREEELSASIAGTNRMLLLGSLAGILSVGLANFAIFRETRKRRIAEHRIRDNNKNLEKIVGERTRELEKKNEELTEQIEISGMLENRRNIALEAGNLGMWTLDIENRRVEMDERSLSLFGLEKDSFDGDADKVFGLVDPRDFSLIKNLFESSLEKHSTFNGEFRVKMTDGEIRWNHCTGQPQFDERGRVKNVVGFCRDITATKKYEEVLLERQNFTQAVLDSLSANIAVVDRQGEIVEVNNAWRDFAAENCLATEDIEKTGIGQNYLDVFGLAAKNDADLKVVFEEFKAVLDGKKAFFSQEYPCHSPDKKRWYLLQVNALKDEKGGAVVSHLDITSRKIAEENLKESEEFSRSIFENSPDCVKILELNGSLHSMNTNGLCIMEIEEFSEYVGQDWVNFWEGDEYYLAQSAVESAATGKTASFEGFCRTAKGTPKWWDVSVAPIFGKDGKPVRLVSTSRDVTERKEAEREREKLLQSEQAARKEAEIANRLRDEFLATVSHELRAPLNSILGWAKLMQQGKLDQKTTEKALETIVRNANSQNRLIEDLLDVSRIISGKLRLEIMQIQPVNFVESALESVRPAANAKNIALEVVEDTGISHISGDSNRLQQVIWNLLSNAIKFTPNGGKVSVGIERNNGHVEIKVKDTGIGIKEEFLPHVFDRFRQADASSIRKFGGLGLGLAIVRHITEMHGGSVEVASAGENRGTTFTVKLPLAPALSDYEINDSESNLEEFLRKDLNLKLDGLLILVVDDESEVRQLLVQALTQYGATVVTASSAKDALTEVSIKSPDLIVSDIGMPDEDGYSLMRKIRATNDETAKIPAVALTAFSRAQDRTCALAAGFQSHVSKPVEFEELVTVIASLTGRLQINDKKLG